MNTVSERLRYAREVLGGYKSARSFALAHGLSATAYYTHEVGNGHENGRNPKKQTVEKYAKLLNVNFFWLWTGIGEPRDIRYDQPENIGGFSDTPYTGKAFQKKEPASTAAEIADFLIHYESLSSQAKKSVRMILLDEARADELKKDPHNEENINDDGDSISGRSRKN